MLWWIYSFIQEQLQERCQLIKRTLLLARQQASSSWLCVQQHFFSGREWTAFIHTAPGLLCEERAGDRHTAVEIGAVRQNWVGCIAVGVSHHDCPLCSPAPCAESLSSSNDWKVTLTLWCYLYLDGLIFHIAFKYRLNTIWFIFKRGHSILLLSFRMIAYTRVFLALFLFYLYLLAHLKTFSCTIFSVLFVLYNIFMLHCWRSLWLRFFMNISTL